VAWLAAPFGAICAALGATGAFWLQRRIDAKRQIDTAGLVEVRARHLVARYDIYKDLHGKLRGLQHGLDHLVDGHAEYADGVRESCDVIRRSTRESITLVGDDLADAIFDETTAARSVVDLPLNERPDTYRRWEELRDRREMFCRRAFRELGLN
jgi:hypothetical protein